MKEENYPADIYFPVTIAQDEILMDNEGGSEEFLKYSNMEGFYIYDLQNFQAQEMEKAWNRVVEENDSLRLQVFRTHGKKYVQRINPFEYCPLRVVSAEGEEALREKVAAFDREYVMPEDPVLWKASLFVDETGKKGAFAVRFLHICTDGYSMEILSQRLIEVYDLLKKGEEVPGIKTYSYKLAIDADEKYRAGKSYENDRVFWKQFYRRQLFSNYCVPTGRRSFGGVSDRKYFSFGKELTDLSDKYCREHRISVQSLFLTAAALTVYRLTGKNNFVIWNLTHGRQTMVLRKMTGCCTQTIPTQFLFQDEETLEEIAARSYVDYMETTKHARFPMRGHIMLYMAKSILLGYNFAHNWMIFSSMLYETDTSESPYPMEYYEDRLITSQFYSGVTRSKEDVYQFYLVYIPKHYSEQQVQKMFETCCETLKEMVTNPGKKIGELSINRKYRKGKK